ncbi:MAG: glycosyltransferase family protein [Candidatus Margulisbacteria bacterium]|nr:glycosyltransferase family protein [Candidatus Margulisiibacteriota bacterium]MBU1021515.1 glycosyltransferase family protein [Candidatus Margulisiibacteriota bacterium]MBU1728600.1 glycosyltransferase family protein [Candidatus Margulisiibacteriota bacterium]MBU1955821.1 glycosyltransferase family protein [Candidatus Margulisiibacteriota bacterium]
MITALIQARIGSTRLPRKILLDLEGKTVLARVIERVKASKHIDEVIIATTINKEDLTIVALCAGLGIRVFCGSENDVLDRFYQAARLFNIDHIVRVTSDCPLVDPKIIDKVISLHLSEQSDYTTNTLKETYPDGQDVEIFTFEALKKAWLQATLASEREHLTSYIRKNPEIFKHKNLENKENLHKKRWTLDEPEDFEFIKTIYEGLYYQNPLFGMNEILELVNANPAIEKINHHITRNEGYLKSLRKDKVLDLPK